MEINEKTKIKIIGVTACTAGIAHTYMAQEAIVKAAKSRGWDVKIETQGTVGKENALTYTDIENADYVLIAADIKIDTDRFDGKKVFITDVTEPLRDSNKLLDNLIKNATIFKSSNDSHKKLESFTNKPPRKSILDHLLSGVSYMIPFVIAGGLLMAIAGILNGFLPMDENGAPIYSSEAQHKFYQAIGDIGASSMNFMVAAFAGFCAYSIADKPGIAPGFIAGALINNAKFLGIERNLSVTQPGASEPMTMAAGGGIIGGMLVGLLAGFIVFLFKLIAWPKSIKSVANFLLLPVLCTLVLGLIIKFAIGYPIALLAMAIFDGINNLYTSFPDSKIILAALIGAMMAFDLGGPVNKIAWTFGSMVMFQTIGQNGPGWQGCYPYLNTAVAASGAVPPIGTWISTKIFKNKFTSQERQAGTQAVIAGFFGGISEGAIPFAVRDPFRCIFSNIVGSVVAATIAVSMNIRFYMGIGSPLGGLLGYNERFGWSYPVVVLAWFAATLTGCLVTAIILGLIKRKINNEELEILADEKVISHEHWVVRKNNVKLMFTDNHQFNQKLKHSWNNYWINKRTSTKDYWTNVGHIFRDYFTESKTAQKIRTKRQNKTKES